MILASKSPRRREILLGSGFTLEVVPAEIDEKSDKVEIQEKIMDISYKKAVFISKQYSNKYVLGADTVVLIDGEILGKPKNEHEAFSMIKKLSNRSHDVITGYSFINIEKNINISSYEKTKVYFRDLDDHTIRWYISTKEPMDKAGAYGIQGKGAFLVSHINGDFFNVMGFPISNFIKKLESVGILVDQLDTI
ncbi:nucleoside triphosphate pyrophosphatase [Fusobacterium sp. PH5-44]|uniref:nucleoside triphosphate pyrophosphatase n=1 Tax=unclassified Fusobacterium TaxID=2648384 RepID=UPI003D262361